MKSKTKIIIASLVPMAGFANADFISIKNRSHSFLIKADVRDAALSGWHSVVLRGDGKLQCFGLNSSGECVSPAGIADAVQVAAGTGFSAALTMSRKVVVWGKPPGELPKMEARWISAEGEMLVILLADGAIWESGGKLFPAGKHRFARIECSRGEIWALTEDGALFKLSPKTGTVEHVEAGLLDFSARGGHISGRKKDGKIWIDDNPFPSASFAAIAICSTGSSYIAASSDGRLLSWAAEQTPQAAEELWRIPAEEVSCLRADINGGMCASNKGMVLVWGMDRYGCLRIGGKSPVRKLSFSGNGPFVALRADGQAIGWGRDQQYQTIGGWRELPAAFPISPKPLTLAHVHGLCGYGLSHNFWVFGWNEDQCLSIPEDIDEPTDLVTGANWAGVLERGNLRFWGIGAESFAAIPQTKKFLQIVAGDHWGAGLTKDGDVFEWGTMQQIDPQRPRPFVERPVQINNVQSISAGGGGHILALTPEGRVLAWGKNDHGQCGMPKDLPPATAVAAGYLHSVALLRDGSLRTWGKQEFLPDSVPKLVAISAGDNVTAGITKDGEVWTISAVPGEPTPPVPFGVFGKSP